MKILLHKLQQTSHILYSITTKITCTIRKLIKYYIYKTFNTIFHFQIVFQLLGCYFKCEKWNGIQITGNLYRNEKTESLVYTYYIDLCKFSDDASNFC